MEQEKKKKNPNASPRRNASPTGEKEVNRGKESVPRWGSGDYWKKSKYEKRNRDKNNATKKKPKKEPQKIKRGGKTTWRFIFKI